MGKIVVIDDKPREPQALLFEIRDHIQVVHPREVELELLEESTVVLVDHHLEPEQWPERASYPLACQPMNGVALAAVVRSHLSADLLQNSSPTVVALLSARLNEVAPGFENPPEYLAAQACGLDWAFAKTQREGDLALGSRILSLANAVEALPRNWRIEDPDLRREQITKLLGLESSVWEGTAFSHVERCHPPTHELAEWSDGVAFINWFTQRVLPYPTFLVDENNLAMHLGVRPEWLKRNMREYGRLTVALKPARYRGILEGFLGPRWWVAGIDSLLWSETGEKSLDASAIRSWLESQVEEPLEKVTLEETLILDQNYSFDGAVAGYSECVRVWPDGWPSYADAPWTSLERAHSIERLRAIILDSDIERLAAYES